jgi:hypothetical protein
MQLAPAGIIFRVGPVAATVPYARIAMIRLVSEPVFTAGGESEPDDVAPPGPSVAISGRGVRRVFRPEGDAAACAAAVHARCPNAVHIALDGTETAPQAGWSRESLASRVATLRRAAIGQSVVGGFLLVLAAASLIKRHAVGEALMFGGLGVGLLLSALRDVRRSRTPPGPPSARTAGSG